jgi:enoyl-CoA hydratase/carnithine racemase
LEHDEDVRVVVFASADEEFFLPHVDIVQVAEYTKETARIGGTVSGSLGGLLRPLSDARQVTIAKVEGFARGGGSELALACDMRFASRERAVFGQIEAGFGAVPGAGGMQHLTRLLGRGRAMEVILSSGDYDADMAESYGWINRALPQSNPELRGNRLRCRRRVIRDRVEPPAHSPISLPRIPVHNEVTTTRFSEPLLSAA